MARRDVSNEWGGHGAPPLGGLNLKIFPNRGAALSRRGSGKFFKLRVHSRLEICVFSGFRAVLFETKFAKSGWEKVSIMFF